MPDMELWPTSRLLSTAARLVELAWNDKLRPLGLTYPAVLTLDAVATAGPITPGDLAKSVRVQAQTMGPLLSRLESRGFIRREPNRFDRRSQLVSITDLGQTLLEQSHRQENNVLSAVNLDSEDLREDLLAIVRHTNFN
ncbi:MarR family winged helix-turn-helix transcriptional regulator [Paenarthrobacter nitroguajacolicus]|uniref:MarR family winged helix-turn-helix transcriptional regulator n=1 Tax=Paenarthrobacter nitroguajacolicus TaxID=211146 RepID=UPI0015B8FCD3|nr:MarR family transcriptional regulator [Paenarthrobacter nitroguajacolicus]NWL31645.1 MarR family transcriptional regulator [Paenarthrobacter nitroguajacolicus]